MTDDNNSLNIFKHKIAMVCASNQNRSMQAHYILEKSGYKNVYSYGTGNSVRLPGPSIDKPNVYPFGTPYATMQQDLLAKDPELYERNGILQMLERNKNVKLAPEKWQHEDKEEFDVVVTFETRVFDAVVEHLSMRDSASMNVVHILGLHIKDNHKEAVKGGELTLKLLSLLAESDDYESIMDRKLEEFEQSTGRQVLHAVLFY